MVVNSYRWRAKDNCASIDGLKAKENWLRAQRLRVVEDYQF